MGRTVARLRVCADAQQGSRRYMEDFVDLRYEKDKNGNTVAFFAVFDGHGGKEAALFARNRMWSNLKRRASFYSDCPKKVCKTISDVFLDTHESMWPHREKWPMTESGYVSTSGCTASVVVIKGSHVFVAHVGDSSVVLAENCGGNSTPDEPINANMLTQDHQPHYLHELRRIKLAGGAVEVKKGVTRVVWRRPSFPGQVATRLASRYTNVPFLSVSRALGDLWSWNEDKREYIVSPNPDVMYFDLDLNKHKFLVIASDGVWNVFPPKLVIKKILALDEERVDNVAEKLVSNVLARCQLAGVRSDNTSAIVIFFEHKQQQHDSPSTSPSLNLEQEKKSCSLKQEHGSGGNSSSDNETNEEHTSHWASVDDVIVTCDSAANEDVKEESVEETSQQEEPINNENDPKEDPMLPALSLRRNLIKSTLPLPPALNEQTNIPPSHNVPTPTPLQTQGKTPVKSAQKRRPDSDIDLCTLSPATKASKMDPVAAPTEQRKSTRNLSSVAASDTKTDRQPKKANTATTSGSSKNSETKYTTAATVVENVATMGEKADSVNPDSQNSPRVAITASKIKENSTTVSPKVAQDNEALARVVTVTDETVETTTKPPHTTNAKSEGRTTSQIEESKTEEENSGGNHGACCETRTSPCVSATETDDAISCEDDDNVDQGDEEEEEEEEEEPLSDDFSSSSAGGGGTTGISCTVPTLKPKGPPPPSSSSSGGCDPTASSAAAADSMTAAAGDEENYFRLQSAAAAATGEQCGGEDGGLEEDEEEENCEPINLDLQSSAISGCNALTTLVLEICGGHYSSTKH